MSKINEPLKNYVSHSRIAGGIHIVAENAVVDVVFYSEAVCRVMIKRPGDAPKDFSYAVAADPHPVKYSIREAEGRIRIQTRCVVAKIEKFPVRLAFLTTAGDLINADDSAFGTSWIGEEITTYKKLEPGERFLGLGEKTGHLDRAGASYTNWNTDYFAYPADADPLYTTLPFYIGGHHGLAYGIFLDSTYRSTFNFGAANDRFSFFSIPAGPMDYYFIHDETVAGILRAFTGLVGRMPLPPLWSLGYQQCRFSYYPDREVMAVARGFRDRDIPADAIYLDIHYMAGFRVFTWDHERFPAPVDLAADLKKMGSHVLAILDPGIKIEDGFTPYEDGKDQDVFVKYPDGEPYAGEVWPGWCHFPDFTRPETRRWWGGWLKDFVTAGIEGFWTDMNEPSAWGHHIPDLLEFSFDGKGATHKEAHNVYGMQMARSTWEGMRQWRENIRPFVLTRSGYTGVQRYASVWTGDNISDDAHMLADVRMVNSMGISGMPFCGYDIGGFVGECSPDLFARWISIGVFAPLAWGHPMVNSRDAEPWSFGEGVEAVARNYIKLRYRLLPYIYSAFYVCSQSGIPVARSLAVDYFHDPMIYAHAYEHQYLFGDAILVIPVASDVRIAELYLPAGGWYDFYSDARYQGSAEIYSKAPKERLPLFVRAGAVIPMQDPVSCTDEISQGPLQIHVYRDSEKESASTYYEDDGYTMDYQKGNYFKRDIRLSKNALILEPADGKYPSRYSRLKIYFHGFDFNDQTNIHLNGRAVPLQAETIRFFEPVSPLDKNGGGIDPYGDLPVFSVLTDHVRAQMRFEF